MTFVPAYSRMGLTGLDPDLTQFSGEVEQAGTSPGRNDAVLQDNTVLPSNAVLPGNAVSSGNTVLEKVSVKAMEYEEMTDTELVRRAAQRDKEAYRVLVEKYQNRAFNIAFELLRNREDAEDVVQESFVKAYLSLPDFKFQSGFYTWLYRIVYNMAIDYKRKIARGGGAAVEFDDLLHVNAGEAATVGAYAARIPYDEVLRKEQARIIDEAMREISDEHRAVIMLRELDGMNYDEIARATGVSKGTIMSRLHYARKKLQGVLKELVNEGPDGQNDKAAGNNLGDGKLSPGAC